MAVQWPALRREGFTHQWILDLGDPGLHEVMTLMGPGVVGQAAAQVNLLVNTWLATSQGTGAVSWLSNAFRLMYLPIGIFGVSIATAAIPDLARHAARGAYADIRSTLSAGMRLMLMLSVPSFVGLVALARPIVEATLQGGAFRASDTEAVSRALWFYAPGLVGYSIVKIVSPCFYALRDARTPVITSGVSMIANLVLNVVLVQVLGYRGLALGTGIAANVNAGLLLFILSKRIGGVDGARVARAFAKITVASCVMGVAAFWAETGLHHLLPGQWLLPRVLRVGGAIGAALGVLGLAAHFLRIEEFGAALRRVLSRS
jgi:putative peptidoglycan lipid II flippase